MFPGNTALSPKRLAVRTLIFCLIFIPILAIGTAVGIIMGLPDSTALRSDALYIRELMRKIARQHQPNNALRNEAPRLRLAGILYDNPEAYFHSSLTEQKNGNLDNALMDMELAIGLLELYSPQPTKSAEYKGRRDVLREALAQRIH